MDKRFYKIGYWGQFYKKNFHNKLVFAPGKPFLPSVIFVGKANSLP